MFSPDLSQRLGKLVRLLATENDGEAVAAARAIGRALEAEKLDFHTLADLIEGKARRSQFENWPAPTRSPVRPRPPGAAAFNYADAYGEAERDGDAPEHPDSRTRKFGLPVFRPDRVASWAETASHCLDLNRAILKKHGGRFLRDFEIRILEPMAVDRYWPTNAQATWIETVVARCHQARSRAQAEEG